MTSVRPLIAALFVAACVLVAMLSAVELIERETTAAVEAEAKDGMMMVAKMVAATIDMREHQSLKDASQDQDPIKLAAEARLKAIQDADERIAYLYTVRHQHSELFWILDSTPTPPPGEKDESVVLMEPYNADVPLELRLAIMERKATTTAKLVEDKWGSHMIAYAPLFCPDSDKVLGVVGVDMEAGYWNAKFAKVRHAMIDLRMLSFVVAGLVGAIVLAVRLTIDAIDVNRKRLGGGV